MIKINKPEYLRRLGAWIRKLRIRRGLSQDTLGKKAGLGSGTVSKVESGEADPKVSTIAKMATVMDVPPSELVKVDVPTE